jgi:hypothetical protein
MPITFPIAPIDFMRKLLVSGITFDIQQRVEQSETGGGEILSADMGPALWEGEVMLGKMHQIEAADAEALIDVLRPAGRTFLAYDARRRGPLMDLDGVILGAATPTIHSIPSGGRELRLQNLPANYPLRRGDYVAFSYDGRRALHRIVDGIVNAGTGGITDAFEVVPMVRPGATVGTPVLLRFAGCVAKMVPGSVNKGSTYRSWTEGMSFRFQQSLG